MIEVSSYSDLGTAENSSKKSETLNGSFSAMVEPLLPKAHDFCRTLRVESFPLSFSVLLLTYCSFLSTKYDRKAVFAGEMVAG